MKQRRQSSFCSEHVACSVDTSNHRGPKLCSDITPGHYLSYIRNHILYSQQTGNYMALICSCVDSDEGVSFRSRSKKHCIPCMQVGEVGEVG